MRVQLLCVATLALGACAVAPAVAPVAPTAVEAKVSSLAKGSQLRLRFAPPASAAAPAKYALAEVPLAHRWVPSDVVQYRVVLKRRLAEESFDEAAAVTVVVPLKGDAPKSTAVFNQVPWGSFYRAYVTAEGNVGGDAEDEVEVLNHPSATADFDFTAENDVPTVVERVVQVVLDPVPFNGQARVGFTAPQEGVFANPTEEVEATTVPPTAN